MSWLKNLFKKKPGGTVFGNMLRGVAKTATGGILGNGANMIPLGTPIDGAQVADPMGSGQNQASTVGTAPVATPIDPSTVGIRGILNASGLGVLTGDTAIKVDVGAQTPELPPWLLPVGIGVAALYMLKGKSNSRRY
jgi:hypothetical protein